jgi:uncharacterized membrane protein YgdD (TMEM256/DUF423 family)
MTDLKDSSSGWVAIAAVLGFLAVALGAIAAHAISDPKAVVALEKAALYQLIHAVVLLFASQLNGRLIQLSRWVILIGVVLFCGSIELKYLLNVQDATVLAPSGGLCLMLGWIMLGMSGFWKKRLPSSSS